MKRVLFSIFTLTFICNTAAGQETSFGFREGTITKKDGSSIRCFVEFAVTYYSKVAYKLTENGKKFVIGSDEIESIRTPYRYVKSITLGKTERLMVLITEGHAELFSYIKLNPGKTEQGYGGTYSFYAPPTIIYAIKKDNSFTEIKKKDFKQKLSELLKDQPEIVKRINENGFKFSDVEKIVNEYNEIHKIKATKKLITIKVVDVDTRKPVKDAKVSIQGTNINALSNFLGFMQISVEAIDTLVIEHPDYEIGLIKVPEENSFQVNLTRMPEKVE